RGLGLVFALAFTALNDFGNTLTPALGDQPRTLLLFQRIKGRTHHVVRIGRSQALRHDVAHAETFEHGAHRAAGDDPGALFCRTHHSLAGAMMTAGFMMQRAPVLERHADHGALCGFRRLADRFGNFTRFAVAEADTSALIADHHKRGKAEPPSAFDHFGDAV